MRQTGKDIRRRHEGERHRADQNTSRDNLLAISHLIQAVSSVEVILSPLASSLVIIRFSEA